MKRYILMKVYQTFECNQIHYDTKNIIKCTLP
jgi:hypothetical protein